MKLYKIQTKAISGGKRWQDMRNGRTFSTEALAWEQVAALDPDGIIDRDNYRVVEVKR